MVVQKTSLFLKVDNFVAVNGWKACDMSKVLEFSVEKRAKLWHVVTQVSDSVARMVCLCSILLKQEVIVRLTANVRQ